MEKKLYLKPELEVLEVESEDMIAATIAGGGSYGDGSDEYHVITGNDQGSDASEID